RPGCHLRHRRGLWDVSLWRIGAAIRCSSGPTLTPRRPASRLPAPSTLSRRPAPMARWSRRRSTASTCWTVPPSIPRSRSIRLWRPLPGASRLATALAVVRAWWHRCRGGLAGVEPGALPLERPWRRTWGHLPKRSAGADFTRADYAAARARAREVARATLGEALWAQLQSQGYLDVPSTHQPGLTYRLRVGRRIEVRCAPGVRS